MKKFLLAMTMLLGMAASSQAMSYEQARQQALFLADKMAYELNLTEEQYEACYEVNLDYLMKITSADDLYGDYWTRRNLDLSYILLDWQYQAFLDATYFYRPLYWSAGYWHFGIYARYPHRDYFYFGRPSFWSSYRGGHSWHNNGGHSWYHGRDFAKGHHGEPGRSNRGSAYQGMRDDFNNGNYGRGQSFGKDQGKPGRDRNNDMRGQSSTRSTVGNTARPNNSERGSVGNGRSSVTGTPSSGTRTRSVVSSQRMTGGSSVNRGSSVSRGTTSSSTMRQSSTSSSRSSGFTPSTSRSSSRVSSGSSSSRSVGASTRSGSGSRGGFSGGGSSRSGGSSSGGSHGGRR